MIFLTFFFNYTATTVIFTLSLHDALPILLHLGGLVLSGQGRRAALTCVGHATSLRRPGGGHAVAPFACGQPGYARANDRDRKRTRLNSSHANISSAVFRLKKKHTYIE